ncbi:MAG: transposase [Armatimonadota bacterium]|nr:transposase [Armatimonadota bacterium]
MPRVARAIVEGVAYHVTQRGNRRQDVFFSDDDRRSYLASLKDYCARYALDMLAYCLMTNHVHLVTLPQASESLALTLRAAHMRHSQMINAKLGWSGHLWQGRYFSTALDETHLWAAVRYVELNPVRAEDYPWSSAAFHLGLRNDKLLRSETQRGGPVENWRKELEDPPR